MKTWLQSSAAFMLVAALMVFLKLPFTVSANIEVQPKQQTFFSQIKGNISKIYVREGQKVQSGELLAEIDTNDTQIELLNKESKKLKAKTEMFKMRAENNIADYKIKESEYISLDYEIELLKEKIKRSKIYASQAGVIISENLQDLLGKPVNFGEEIIKLASEKELVINFEIPEASVRYVEKGQEVAFKVYGDPNNSISNEIKLYSVSGEGRQVLESDPNKYYMAKAFVNADDIEANLRPGMTGRGKVYTQWQSLGHIVFSPVYNFLAMNVFF